ncbi:hypothetical protein ACFWZ3_06335 [Frateuria sp. GZRR35]|uniref:Tse2 family ADP-ribosyltransferase toxin n=1 Tax=unclassified Frateuria TaxID=2648894 RepID=UPI003EDC3368
MTDALKNIYRDAGRSKYYFDDTTPRDLYRGQSKNEARQGRPVLHPNPGFRRRDGSERLPDVKIVERDGRQIVIGCRCVSGDYRGVSTFDRTTALGGFRWYRLPKGTAIPEAIAVTQDSDFSDRANHFTLAPKDDMPLELFQIWLNALAKNLQQE